MGIALLVPASRRVGTAASAVVWFAWAVAFFLPHLSWAREAAGLLA